MLTHDNLILNKYTKWYISLIENRIQNTPDGYSEKHHILPKCAGGSDESHNLVRLTAREHYIAHLLLAKMFNGNLKHRLKFALTAFNMSNGSQQREFNMNSRLFESMTKDARKDAAKHHIGKFAAICIATGETEYIRVDDERYLRGEYVAKSKGVLKGTTKTEEHKRKLAKSKVGSQNPQSKYLFHTPNGVFESSRLAAEANNTTNVTVYNRCVKYTSAKFKDWYVTPVNEQET
ncbi:mob-like homing endonuclease [Vibrio phage phi-ST2]|nr:mob-like homing endonuclease [Vibrio phage phi-ST2]